MKFIFYLIRTNLALIRKATGKKKIERRLEPVIAEIQQSTVVKSGPFAGMQYPQALAYGSSFFPKILGTYEKEIQSHIAAMKNSGYDTIIDVGCAEGYYAVGLKRMFPRAKVYAFDINEDARRFCLAMAKINDCTNDFHVEGEADVATLKKNISGKTLIVCDCEGYESTLFSNGSNHIFRDCDLVIETHDFIDDSISTRLHESLSLTHDVETVQSLDDHLKAKYYELPGMDGLSLEERKYLVAEHRPQIMEWLICKKRS